MYNLDVEEMEGRWVAYVSPLPGCYSGAETRQAAVDGAPQAVADFLAWLRAHGEQTPDEAVREMWSPRKMLRRALWHERDHTDPIWQFRARSGRV